MAGRSWIKLWLSLLGNERFGALTDAERWGYVHILMVGESVGYTFANEGQLKLKAGASYRYAKRLRAVGLLDGLTIYQGKERQAPVDPTAAERQARYRDRNAAVINGDVTGDSLVYAGGKNPEVRDLTPVSNETSPSTAAPSRAQLVFEAWKKATGRNGATKFSAARRRVIGRALKDYPAEDIWDALRGWQNDPWPDRVHHTDVTVLLKDAGHIEKFRDLWRRGAPTSTALPRAVAEQKNYMAALDAAMEREEAHSLT